MTIQPEDRKLFAAFMRHHSRYRATGGNRYEFRGMGFGRREYRTAQRRHAVAVRYFNAVVKPASDKFIGLYVAASR